MSLIYSTVKKNGLRLRHASKKEQADKQVVLAAVAQNGRAIHFASPELQIDSDVVRTAIKNGGLTVQDLTPMQVQCKSLVLAGVSGNWLELQTAGARLRADKDVVLAACQANFRALEHAAPKLKCDPDFVLAICVQHGAALQHASNNIQSNKDVVMAICRQHGSALQYAADNLRADKEVVLTAVKCEPDALKYALQGLNQDAECLIAAKLWDEGYTGSGEMTKSSSSSADIIKIVLSTKFSLNAQSSSTATQFTTELKRHPYIRDTNTINETPKNFVVYSPNAFSKGTCDPEWTRMNWPCRGTYETCRSDNALKTDIPQPGCCWRYSFRLQLVEAKRSDGFMLQLVDYDAHTRNHNLGKGQQIETEMARDVGTKLFRVYQPAWNGNSRPFCEADVGQLVKCIQEWYESHCKRKSRCDISPSYFKRKS